MNAVTKGNRVCILVHRQELLRQASRSLDAMQVPHGVISPTHNQTNHPVQVASVQTLIRRLRKDPDRYHFDLIIIDEAHHATAGSWREVTNLLPNARILGVTATPCRSDGQGLGYHSGGMFDAIVIGPSIQELTEEGYLVPAEVYAPPTDLDMTGVKRSMGDYDRSETEKRVDKPTITGSAVEHYRKLCDGQPAVAFCVSVQHAEHVAADFRANGYRAISVDGSMDDTRRADAIAGLASGKYQVLTSCDIVSEGTDIPVIACAILLRPTQSLGLFLQQVGRALRPAPGKTKAIILDHVGNCIRHGLPSEDREWSLSGRTKGKRSARDEDKPPPVRQCEGCYAVFKPAPACPNCGREVTIKGRKLREIEGELEQLNAEKLSEARRKKELARQIAMADSLDALNQIAMREGYKPGWAYHKWHARKRKAA